MTPTPHGDSARRHHHHRHHGRRPLRHGATARQRTVHGRHRAAARAPAHGRAFSTRPTTVWPFADAEPLPGTARPAGWLGRMVLTLVTGYTRPGDRVLLLAPPAPPRGGSTGSAAPSGTRAADPYAGLTEAVWTLIRLGRGVSIATAAPAADCLCDPADLSADSPSWGETGSGSGSRPGRLGLRTPTDPHRESEHHPRRTACRRTHRPDDRFDLIITAVHPHAAGWFADTDWDTALTHAGTLAVVTHSDTRPARLPDVTPAIVGTVRSQRRGWLDHIAVLTEPLSSALANSPACSSLAPAPVAEPVAEPLPLRAVHHDLLLFGPVPATSASAGGHVEPAAAKTRGDLG